uniref:NADH-ubiquinone oxidoreductase chain 3 n=1 Tax=Anaxandra taurina TaxID=2575663 RepID=A0A4D6X1M3_9HEMI|nr:NADH dehydrogenase subunit 3 [Anaxandra taurina]QCI09242.1 NADH dehydrogenase subunit 3 [Anaxandra taurina]
MLLMITTAMVTMIIPILLMTICAMISKKSIKDREKMSPFECGFDPMSSARTPFSIQFFLIAVLFLIFDVEIAILLPVIITMKWSMNTMWIMTISSFLLVLILGLLHEWKNGMLEWM